MIEDYHALREAAALVDLSHRGKIEVTGADRVTFLQGMVTNDVKTLPVGRGIYAALLTRTGKIVADMNILREPERFLVDVESTALATVTASFQKHAVTEDAKFADVTASNRALAILGPQAARIVFGIAGEDVGTFAPLEHRGATAVGLPVKLVRTAAVPILDGFELWSDAPSFESLRAAVLEKGSAFGLKAIGPAAIEAARIEAGIPRLGPDLGGDYNPVEVGLGRAISYTKGCYLGQEVVSKATRVGRAGRRLVGLKIEGEEAPSPGAEVLANGEAVGKVTSAVLSPALGRPIALAYVSQSAANPGTALAVRLSAGTPVPAEVCALPFIAPPASPNKGPA